ncbi:MAG TPA: glycosyltransferase family 39 protein [Chitinophagaceae bacterium]
MENNQQKYFWLLFVLSIVLLFPGLGKTPLWIYDEVRNAECAREMYERNDWIVPTFNGGLRTLKPPLHYYFMFGGFKIFGITEWGARFFSAVFGVLTIFITYFFVKKYSSQRQALITVLVLLASTHFLFEFRMSVPDPYLIFLNTASIFAAYLFFKEKRNYWLWLCAITMGLGTLAKGPVAIALPGAAIFIWLTWEKRLKEIFSWKILVAGVIMCAVALPWYLLVHKETNGEWTKGFFLQHNFGRFSEPMEGHGGPFIIVPIIILLGLLPASIFIGESFKKFRTRFKDPFLKLALSVVGIFVVFYSISSTKLPNYAMPCYAFVAILLGSFINKAWEENKARLYPFIILLVINIALPIAAYLGIKKEVNTTGMENIALFLLILTIAAVMAFYFMLKKNFRKAAISTFAFYSLFHIVMFNWLYPTIYKENPMSKTVDMVKKYDKVISYQIFHPSYTYYLPERVPVFKSLDSLKTFMQNNKAVVITRKNFAEELKSIGLQEKAAVHDLFEGNTTMIFVNPE